MAITPATLKPSILTQPTICVLSRLMVRSMNLNPRSRFVPRRFRRSIWCRTRRKAISMCLSHLRLLKIQGRRTTIRGLTTRHGKCILTTRPPSISISRPVRQSLTLTSFLRVAGRACQALRFWLGTAGVTKDSTSKDSNSMILIVVMSVCITSIAGWFISAPSPRLSMSMILQGVRRVQRWVACLRRCRQPYPPISIASRQRST